MAAQKPHVRAAFPGAWVFPAPSRTAFFLSFFHIAVESASYVISVGLFAYHCVAGRVYKHGRWIKCPLIGQCTVRFLNSLQISVSILYMDFPIYHSVLADLLDPHALNVQQERSRKTSEYLCTKCFATAFA